MLPAKPYRARRARAAPETAGRRGFRPRAVAGHTIRRRARARARRIGGGGAGRGVSRWALPRSPARVARGREVRCRMGHGEGASRALDDSFSPHPADNRRWWLVDVDARWWTRARGRTDIPRLSPPRRRWR